MPGDASPVYPDGMELSDEAREILAWRRSLRADLIAARMAMPQAAHRAASAAVAAGLGKLLSSLPPGPVGFYWPIRREFDPLPLMREFVAAGGTAALPVVVKKNHPLEFRRWTPDARMANGVYDIPYPADGEIVTPCGLLIPMVGFDKDSYRLGYGGGYYDRTLAALQPRPRCIGIAFELGRIETIRPLSFDMRMDAIVTEGGVA